MQTKTGNYVAQSTTLSTILLMSLLLLPAAAQQRETSVTAPQNKSSAQSPATRQNKSEPEAQSSPAIVLPITCKGTTNFLPVFTGPFRIGNSLVSQTGNGISVSGTVSAVSFTGDGSGLTNVPAVQLGGLPASAFAQTGASNTFTADQTINGNLNLTGYINSAFSLQGNLIDANGQEGANVLGGFQGNSQFPGNSIAPGVIGATIGGGGGVYDPSLLPAHAARKLPGRRPMLDRQKLRSPFARRSPLQGDTAESSEPEAKTEQAPPKG